MNRRRFLQIVAASGAGAALCAASGRGDDQPAAEKLFLSAPLTHSDWMLKPGIEWGAAGVRHMLDACKAAGWSRVYWRVCDAGQATYKSKVMRPAMHADEDNIFNPLSAEGQADVKRLLPNLTPEQGKGYLQKMARMDYGDFDSLA